MKTLVLILSFCFSTQLVYASQDFVCPKDLALNLKNQSPYQNFEIYPQEVTYPVYSALLYLGHPKELGALKGSPVSRDEKKPRFWLECKYKFLGINEIELIRPTLIMELPNSITKCEYIEKYTAVRCK